MYLCGDSYQKIANKFGVSRAYVFMMVQENTPKWMREEVAEERKRMRELK